MSRIFRKLAKCQFDLLQLKASWEWASDCEQTFRLLKEKPSSTPVFAYREIDGEEIILDTDASHFGIGAILSKFKKDHKEFVIG